MRCLRLPPIVLVIATSLLVGCATAPSSVVVCPQVVEYQQRLVMRAAAEVEALPSPSAVEIMLMDYATMRDQARACRGETPKERK